MRRSAIFVAEDEVFARLLERVARVVDLARHGHHVHVRADDMEAVDDVRARQHEVDLGADRQLDPVRTVAEDEGENNRFVFVVPDLTQTRLVERLVLRHRLRVDGMPVLARRRYPHREGGRPEDEQEDRQHGDAEHEPPFFQSMHMHMSSPSLFHMLLLLAGQEQQEHAGPGQNDEAAKQQNSGKRAF